MGQTLVKNYLHIVFSTKNRIQLIDEKIENELYAYLGGICNNLNCPGIKVGGYLDHVHILTMLNKNIPLSKLMEEVKSHSSKWIKNVSYKYNNFYWQNGYGAFSVRADEVEKVIQYIANQKEHHSKINFQNEYRQMLNRFGVEYDEKFIWV